MGLARRKGNQLAQEEAEVKEEMAAEAKLGRSRGASRTQQQPQNPFIQYLWAVSFACVFWVVMQALFKYAAHLA